MSTERPKDGAKFTNCMKQAWAPSKGENNPGICPPPLWNFGKKSKLMKEMYQILVPKIKNI